MASIQKDIIIGNGKTTLPNLFSASTIVTYKDLGDQTTAYKKKLDMLASYNLLRKSDQF